MGGETSLSGIIVDRALLHLPTQSPEFRPGVRFASVLFEIAASGFKVRVKGGILKSIDPLTILGKSMKEETRIFKVEEDARCYFEEQIELFFRRVGFHHSAPHKGSSPIATGGQHRVPVFQLSLASSNGNPWAA